MLAPSAGSPTARQLASKTAAGNRNAKRDQLKIARRMIALLFVKK
jgi:hypothetical protein